MQAQQRETIFRILSQLRPNPQSELNYRSPFELLIAVMLSAQATDNSVNAATQSLFACASTPQDFVALGVEGLIPYIRTIGLYRAKAGHIIQTCERLLSDYAGAVPDTFAALTSLPGVGPKTANVVLNVAFDQPTVAVDTHIFRVANRTGLACGKTPDEVSAQLVRLTPPVYLHNAHHWLLLHGRYCCKARRPLCPECPIAALCEFADKTV